MWEDMDSRSRKKSKGQRLFSNGVVVLVCLILAAQAVFFGKYLIDSRRTMREGQRQEEIQGSQDNTPGQEGPSARDGSSAQAPPSHSGCQLSSGGTGRHSYSSTGQGGSSSRRTGRTSYDGQPGRTPSATAAARSGSTSDNHPSERTFSPEPASTPASAAGSSPHTDSPRDSRTGYNPTLSYPHDGWSWDRVELNSADSAALDALPGIGPYYARQIIAYRERIGFFADISQLLDIRGMDTARLRRLADRLYIAPESLRPLDLYTMPIDSLAAHPYIGPYAAKGIDRLRRTLPETEFTFQAILDSRILPPAQARRLALYFPETNQP